jgi:hypothetical protein
LGQGVSIDLLKTTMIATSGEVHDTFERIEIFIRCHAAQLPRIRQKTTIPHRSESAAMTPTMRHIKAKPLIEFPKQ